MSRTTKNDSKFDALSRRGHFAVWACLALGLASVTGCAAETGTTAPLGAGESEGAETVSEPIAQDPTVMPPANLDSTTALDAPGFAVQAGATFVMFLGTDGEYYFHLRAANGRIVLTSEGYASKSGRDNGIASVRANGVDAANYAFYESASGETGVNLRAGNHHIIARGETYATRAGAERAVARMVELVSLAPNVSER